MNKMIRIFFVTIAATTLSSSSGMAFGLPGAVKDAATSPKLPQGIFGAGLALQAPAVLMDFVAASPLETRSRVAHARSFGAKDAQEFKRLQLQAAKLENANLIARAIAIPGALSSVLSSIDATEGKEGFAKENVVGGLIANPLLSPIAASACSSSLNEDSGYNYGERLAYQPLSATGTVPLIWYSVALKRMINRRDMHRALAENADKAFSYIHSAEFLKKYQITDLNNFARQLERAENIAWYTGLGGFAAQAALLTGGLWWRHNNNPNESWLAALDAMASWLLNPVVVKPIAKRIAARKLKIKQIERDLKKAIGFKVKAAKA